MIFVLTGFPAANSIALTSKKIFDSIRPIFKLFVFSYCKEDLNHLTNTSKDVQINKRPLTLKLTMIMNDTKDKMGLIDRLFSTTIHMSSLQDIPSNKP